MGKIISMEIRETFVNGLGIAVDRVYREGVDPVQEPKGVLIQGIAGVDTFCFYGDKMVVVFDGKKKYWGPPKGGVEPHETFEEAVVREVKEEANMKVLHQELIGFVDFYIHENVIRTTRNVEVFCIVEPYGDFVSDPDDDITEIKLIDPSDYKQYFDWGNGGDHVIKRAIELKDKKT